MASIKPQYQPFGCQHLIAEARALFGSAVLSRREKQVVDLMLQSYRLDTCAEKLGLSIETLRVHRRNIYRKLDINSHLELFSLLFACLEIFTSGNQDPLLSLNQLQVATLTLPNTTNNKILGLINECPEQQPCR